MKSYGLRISEVLHIQYTAISNNGTIIIKSLKGSNDRIINLPELKEYLLHCKQYGNNPFDLYNRWYCYREFKKLGIYYISGKSSKNSITHAFRHMIVADLKEQGLDNVAIAKYMGHKNHKNIDYYGN